MMRALRWKLPERWRRRQFAAEKYHASRRRRSGQAEGDSAQAYFIPGGSEGDYRRRL